MSTKAWRCVWTLFPSTPTIILAPSAGKARYILYLSLLDVFPNITFQAIRVRRAPEQDKP